MSIWFNLLKGVFGDFGDNEVRGTSTIDDPFKYRGGVLQSALRGTNLCGLSGNITRDDGNDEEYGLVMIRRNGQTGAIYLEARCADGISREIAYFDPSVAIFHMPISAPNLGTPAKLSRFYSDTGTYMINFQSAGGDLSPIVYRLVAGDLEDAHPVGRLTVTPL